ncbi:MAG: hypothetical protein KKD69_00925 [Euryarchaeota archaeon]|nr:hypothetical protein [Euryarchaeota archaeon]MBU4491011.1 hypothetical protein [Euryarchaeota archaeon]MCG2727388.1 hypothetical protein [Candidatus Methanoperedenaceae archaeon]
MKVKSAAEASCIGLVAGKLASVKHRRREFNIFEVIHIVSAFICGFFSGLWLFRLPIGAACANAWYIAPKAQAMPSP